MKGENWTEGEREPKERWPEFVLETNGDSDASEGKHKFFSFGVIKQGFKVSKKSGN